MASHFVTVGEGESGDSKGARIERAPQGPEHGEGDQLVQHHAGAEEIADGVAVAPGQRSWVELALRIRLVVAERVEWRALVQEALLRRD